MRRLIFTLAAALVFSLPAHAQQQAEEQAEEQAEAQVQEGAQAPVPEQALERPQERPTTCRGVAFADMLWVRFGKPSAPVAFVGSRAALGRADLVALGAHSGAQVCAEKLKGSGVGWLPSDALEKIARINDLGSFVGTWRRGAAEIRITWLDDGRLTVDGRGAGAFSGEMDMRDGIGLYDGEGAETRGCRVRMARGGDILLVRDNGQCGGGFGGIYARAAEARSR
jgi:hypothetical protein